VREIGETFKFEKFNFLNSVTMQILGFIQDELNVHNGKESTVNKALGGSTYPG
jgi:hypothetical protein